MTESMAERVARAIYEKRGLLKPVEAFPTDAPWAQRALEEARAAIEAMRGATDEMLTAGARMMVGPSPKGQNYCTGVPRIYSAMIGEALK